MLSFNKDSYRQFIFYRTYSRWKEDSQRRETWEEVVDRYMSFMSENLGLRLLSEDYDEIRDAILNQEVMPSMRLMWGAGKPARLNNAIGYNCSYLAPTSWQDFGEILFLLTCGCGVGFSCEEKFVSQLPAIKPTVYKDIPTKRGVRAYGDWETYTIPDSREGWADSLVFGLSRWAEGKDVVFDYSDIRPKGSRLKTTGGRASGPLPLKNLHEFARKTMIEAQGRKLTPLEVHDIICKIGDVVVAGGVRRSSEISLSDLTNEEMRDAKKGEFWNENPQRAMANNSAVYNKKPTREEFDIEWKALRDSGSGERGIFNRGGLKHQMPERRVEANLDYIDSMGTNPCFHPDTLIETVEGRKRIADITEPTYVYSMDEDGRLVVRKASASWISKKSAKTLVITINNGTQLTVTPDHKIYTKNRGWVEAKDLKINDEVSHLSRTRRGACYAGVKLTTQGNRDRVMEHRFIYSGVHGNIPDGYDIHHKDGDTYNNCIDNLELIEHSSHATLTRHSCANDHQVKSKSTGRFISSAQSKGGKKKIIDLPDNLKTNLRLQAFVKSIDEGSVSDVYDISVEDTHNVIANNIVAHNCGEINLRSKQFCNLSEVVVRPDDTHETLKEKVRIATIIGTYQSMLTDFPYLSDEWKKNCEDERLLGVSLTGQMDNPKLWEDTEAIDKLKKHAVEINKYYAQLFGINQSTSVTCVKPSGTVSQLVNSASGLHPRFFKYYVKNVRISSTDPLFTMLKESGIEWYPEVGQTEDNMFTAVIPFPIKSPDDTVTQNEVSALDQLEHWKVMKMHWTEHNPSCTVTIGDDEWDVVADWIWDNWEIIGGLSFIPKNDLVYKLAPYEEITKDEYEKKVANMPDIDFTKLSGYEKEDNTEGAKSIACGGGVCDTV